MSLTVMGWQDGLGVESGYIKDLVSPIQTLYKKKMKCLVMAPELFLQPVNCCEVI